MHYVNGKEVHVGDRVVGKDLLGFFVARPDDYNKKSNV